VAEVFEHQAASVELLVTQLSEDQFSVQINFTNTVSIAFPTAVWTAASETLQAVTQINNFGRPVLVTALLSCKGFTNGSLKNLLAVSTRRVDPVFY